MASQRDKTATFSFLLLIVTIVVVGGALLAPAGGGSRFRDDESRDFAIKRGEIDQFRFEERVNKELDELRSRIEKLEQRQ